MKKRNNSPKSNSFVKHYYLMLLPGFVWVTIFCIVPMFGIAIAFQNYNPAEGIFGSEWIGLGTFEYMFVLKDTWNIFFNTLFIACLKIVGNLIVPLVFALMLNEARNMIFKRSVQTIVYLPHFLSWVILGGIILDIFSYGGPVNQLLALFGLDEPILFFAKAELFPYFLAGSDVWKEFGFNTIIYLAALTGINPALYEAASIDGANRLRMLWHITLPGIRTTAALLAVLSLGQVLNAGFDQVFNLYNPLVYSTGDIIDTWVYRVGLLDLQYELGTAVGLLKSVVGFIMIVISYSLAYRYTNYRIF
ncbi:ABC transporter permease [Aquibacillus albus]|uniref:Aldouronate transport system permease protein n=1 Tax=Aquibacillus albus TaxID=1168171 RepID=A0ABS2MWC9_9BACI|nr:ABC transporter permease subunit [Aquibacillus albus]MBM7570093.1 putative aldouronate transport system permease protein [Aquibacillus albus]